MTRKSILTIVGALLLFAAGAKAQERSAPAAPPATGNEAEGGYQIVPGDILDIIVWRNKDLSMEVNVRPDGWISFPLAGDLRAAGLTVVKLQKSLEQRLASNVASPMVTVIVAKVANLKVSVLGKVRQPGRYPLEGPTTVLDVLAQAGGLTDFADGDAMYVLRRNTSDGSYQRINIRYSLSLAAKTNGNIAVAPGDIVVVP